MGQILEYTLSYKRQFIRPKFFSEMTEIFVKSSIDRPYKFPFICGKLNWHDTTHDGSSFEGTN